MKRLLVVHGTDRGQVCRVAMAAAKRLGFGFRELFGASWESVDAVTATVSDEVLALGSEVLVDRTRRVELCARAITVGIGSVDEWGIGPDRSEVLRALVECGRVGEIWKAEGREGHAMETGVDSDEGSAVERIVDLTRRGPVVGALGEESYLVEVGRGVLEGGVLDVNFGAPVALCVTDENVRRLHGVRIGAALRATGMRVVEHVLTPGEEQKSLGTLGEIFNCALKEGIDRSSWVIGAGGGVTTDIGGLTAALWMRGLRWMAIPTTLLAMVDAAVGGKTAVDFGNGKNAVGAFWQPSRVVCDVEFLKSEAERNYVGALAEVVKTAVVGDAELFGILEREFERVLRRDLDLMSEIVRRCVQVKARVVGLDPRESGLRAVLNLGHTVGHALEVLGGYQKYTHGEAVSLGLVAALRLGVRLGKTPLNVAERIQEMLRVAGLPVSLNEAELRDAAEVLGHDKKRLGSAIRFVFVEDIGKVESERLGLEDLRELVVGLSD
jgi:shikimate kinase / 3-dehydroquinate synthase